MKLSDNTKAILNNFVSFNPSIVIKEGNILATITPAKTAIIIAEVEETFPVECAIYDLRKMLGLLSLFNDPDLIFEKKFVTISDAKKSVNITYADPANLHIPRKNKMKEVEPVCGFTLDKDSLVHTLKALNILGSTQVRIAGDEEDIRIMTINKNDPTSDIFSIDVGKTDKEFSFEMKSENMKMIQTDYKVEASESQILFITTDDKLKYYIAVEA